MAAAMPGHAAPAEPGRAARNHPGRAGTRTASRGFTLVEVLVSLFVLATLAAMAWQGVAMVVRSRAAATERVDQLLRLQSVLAQWETDLREIVDSGNVPAFTYDGASLRLTRRRDAGVQLVVWSVRDSQLLRWTSPVLVSGDALQDAWIHSHQLLPSEAGQLLMLPGVTAWQLYVYSRRSSAWSNALSTGDLKDTGTAAAAPAPAAASGAAPAAPVAATGSRVALPDGVRLSLQLDAVANGATGGLGGTLVRDLQLIHP
jgi:general secretion pathway protein J